MLKKHITDFKVVENKRLNFEYFVLTLHSDEILPQTLPGQFVEVNMSDYGNAFLRRPISIHDVDYDNNNIKLLIQQRGETTTRLAFINKNEIINLILPLGTPFTMPQEKNILLVGGGCGIAPFLFFAKYLSKRGYKPEIIYGARNNNYLFDMSEYEKTAPLHITTEDGSFGFKGLVTDHELLKDKITDFNVIYCCGPEPMMKAVAKKAKQYDIKCQVSLENMMACGIGACLCCVTETNEGHKCVCTEGPVFDAEILKW